MKQKKGYPRKPYSFERVLKDLADDVGYDSLEKIIDEVAAMRQTERGNRTDDKRSETAMEDRKKQGYF